MGAFMKLLILIGGTLISALLVLSLLDPTFGTYLGEQTGFVLGAGSVLLITLSPILIFGFLLWFLFLRRQSSEEASKHGNSTDLGVGTKSKSKNSGSEVDIEDNKGNSTYRRSSDILLDYPRARVAIEYREDIKEDWEKIRNQFENYMEIYLQNLDETPDMSREDLLNIVQELSDRDSHPFPESSNNNIFADLEIYGAQAQAEFREAYQILGSSFDAKVVAERISTKYSKSPNQKSLGEQVSNLTPGVYSTSEGHSFRVYKDGSVMMLGTF